MQPIHVEHNPTEERLKELGVFTWPVWTKEVSKFPWYYDVAETCYFLEGKVSVSYEGGQSVNIGEGDLVTFPQGMSCVWEVRQPVRKHYRFG